MFDLLWDSLFTGACTGLAQADFVAHMSKAHLSLLHAGPDSSVF